MISILSRLTAIAASLMLVLPVGACSELNVCRANERESSCCQRSTPAHSSNTEQPADAPDAACCCSPDPALPENGGFELKRSVDSAAPLSLGSHSHIDRDGPISRDAADDVVDPDPRVHVLHCVWLC